MPKGKRKGKGFRFCGPRNRSLREDTCLIKHPYFTAENSNGFHNPKQARQSLTESIDASQMEILNRAISQKIAPISDQRLVGKVPPKMNMPWLMAIPAQRGIIAPMASTSRPIRHHSLSRPTWIKALRNISRFSGLRGTSGRRSFPAGRPIMFMASLAGAGLDSMNSDRTTGRVL